MKLIHLENFEVKFEEELFLLAPFKKVLKKDKNRDKRDFMEFLTILYFTYDPRSDYMYIVDEDERLNEVCASNGFKLPKFTEDELNCIELYRKLTRTTSQSALDATREGIKKVEDYIHRVNLFEEDDKGKPKYDVAKLTTAMKQMPELAKQVQEMEKAVLKELQESGRARGGNNKTLMDDGILI